MAENIGNLGYLAMIKETTVGVAITPTNFLPFYSETLTSVMNFVDQTPVYGTKFATFATVQGLRSHSGDVTVMAEPNSTARWADMLLTKTSTTGSDPYVHTFQLTGLSNSYTVDISTGEMVKRFWGVQAKSLAPTWNKTEQQWKVTVSALGSFQVRSLASTPTGTNPYTIVLDTTYDPNPTTGLVVGDLIRIYQVAAGTTIDATVASIVNGTSITTTTNVTAALVGDQLYLRPQTASFSLLPTFIWPKTQFYLSDNVTDALASTQVHIEQGSTFEVDHNFEADGGSPRSGSFDPTSLVRTTGNLTFEVKRFFDKKIHLTQQASLTPSAAVIKGLSGTTNQYGYQVNIYSMIADGTIAPQIKSAEVEYSDIKYHVDYSQSDGYAFQLIVTNNVATI